MQNLNETKRLTAVHHDRNNQSYTLPEEIVLQLTFRDVYLEFFKGIKREVLALQSGDSLQYRDFTLYTDKTDLPVAKLSTRMQKTLTDWFAKVIGSNPQPLVSSWHGSPRAPRRRSRKLPSCWPTLPSPFD